MYNPADHHYMQLALELAEQGRYLTTPNPRVGCVIVHDGKIVGQGAHLRAGEPHAEIHALRAAGVLAKGATAYVTLEPCNHFGKTPPCTEALIAAGVKCVVAAMEDPNPQVSGKGLARLRLAGVDVRCGLLSEAAHELNLGFISRMKRGRPWVRTKIAASLDGITALDNGVSQWITSPEARLDGHRFRAMSCAILTGSGTVVADNPQLNVRGIDTARQPIKIILNTTTLLREDLNIWQGAPVWLVSGTQHSALPMHLQSLPRRHFCLPSDAQNRIELHALLMELGQANINELHIEAGASLNGALLQADLLDEIVVYLAPNFLGQGRSLFSGLSFEQIPSSEWDWHDMTRIGSDMRVILRKKASKNLPDLFPNHGKTKN